MNDLGAYYERHRRHIGAAWQPACTDAVASTKWIGGEADPTLRPVEMCGLPAVRDFALTYVGFGLKRRIGPVCNISVSPPKADIRANIVGRRFGPIGDICSAENSALFDHLVDLRKQDWRK
jgi:hypothetical protein